MGSASEWRYSLPDGRGSLWIACDEFTATLDRTLAKVVAFNLRKQASRTGVGLLAATTRLDRRLETRSPRSLRAGNIHPVRPNWSEGPTSFAHELSIAGHAADWKRFQWHYRGSELAFTRRVVLLKHKE